MPYATSTCTAVSSTTTECVYSQITHSPLLVQDAGNVSFGIAIIMTMLAVGMVAFLFNSFGGSKRR